MKNGVTNHLGEKTGSYTFLGNSEEIFEAYFGDSKVIDGSFDLNGSDVFASLLGDAHGAKNQASPNSPSDINMTLNCSLAELYNGSLKTVKYMRSKILPDGRTIQ